MNSITNDLFRHVFGGFHDRIPVYILADEINLTAIIEVVHIVHPEFDVLPVFVCYICHGPVKHPFAIRGRLGLLAFINLKGKHNVV